MVILAFENSSENGDPICTQNIIIDLSGRTEI